MKPDAFKFTAIALSTLFFLSCSENKSDYPTASPAPAESVSTDTTINGDRVLIKTAELNLDVDRLEQSVQDFQQLVKATQGYIFHYEIRNEKQLQQEVQHSLDSNLLITEIHPAGMMKVRIPVQYGDTFIASVLRMNGGISQFLFDENDVTEDITEKKELMLSDAVTHSRPNRDKEDALMEKESRESYIRRKAGYARMHFRTKNLWFDVRLKGRPYTEKQIIGSAAPIRIPFYVRASESIQNGWYGLSVLIILLLNLWPLYIFAVLMLLVLNKYRIKPQAK